MRRAAERTRRLPLRKSLLGRFLAVSALVATCSVAATAWLAAQTTSGAIRKEQGRLLADDAHVYDTLLAYAATRPRWDDVQETVEGLARRTGRRITLTDEHRTPLADSSTQRPRPSLPARESAVVDPTYVDTALSSLGTGGTRVTRRTLEPDDLPPAVTPEPAEPRALVPTDSAPGSTRQPLGRRGAPVAAVSQEGTDEGSRTVGEAESGRIDPRAVGPFRLSPADRSRLLVLAERQARCYLRSGFSATIVTGHSGRPRVEQGDPSRSSTRMFLDGQLCEAAALNSPTPSERVALDALNRLTNTCLDRSFLPHVTIALDLSWSDAPGVNPHPHPTRSTVDRRIIANCLESARREQLSSHVAPRALLFITAPDGGSPSRFDLSTANTAKIAGVAALVLALTVGVSVVAGTRLVRPLHALTGAAQRMKDDGDGDRWTPVAVSGDNEVGRLAAAFNDMAAHRARLEEQRKVMVSDVAHELRTPLSNIRGWLEGAQDGVAEADSAFVSSLLEEAVQLQHIIDDLQDLAEADAGALRLRPEPVRIAELLAQVAAAHQARADAAGVTLTVGAGPDGPPSRNVHPAADPVRLRQAVGNLVSNAIRHTPAGGEVTVRASRGGPRGDLVLEVRDTGEGIAPEHLPYVFDRFWRAEKSRNRRTGGSGLGLAIVRRLAEAHGGTVEVRSAVGTGSVFTLRIPPRFDAPADRGRSRATDAG
ncbi:HAMP domain-containing sensor histidine kinase [Streptomyces sp. NPDC002490]|uniref:sensor histidine kinase n=1 Tax=Streptomyces sp. NPDC002490 TaxID=3154416 RepID=UPI00332C7715